MLHSLPTTDGDDDGNHQDAVLTMDTQSVCVRELVIDMGERRESRINGTVPELLVLLMVRGTSGSFDHHSSSIL